MKYQVIWLKRAEKQFKKLQKIEQVKILKATATLNNSDNWNNVKKLVNHKYDYRLRVGNYRVLFDENNSLEIVEIQEVKKRDDNTY